MAANLYLELVLDTLASLGAVTGRAMFGCFGVFHEGRMFALISDDTLYLKADESNIEGFTRRACPRFKRMLYYRIPEDVFEDDRELVRWAERSGAVNR